MRTVTPTLRDNLLLKSKAVEPLYVLGIEWAAGTEVLYADRKINGGDEALPILNDMGDFNTSQFVSGSGSATTVPFVLSDIQDGTYNEHLKNIVDNNDIHKVKARLYVMVQGVNLIDRTLLVQGEINSPLEWNEGDRTLSFEMISQIESVETGFAIEDGDFPEVPEDARGKPWPFILGDVCWEKTQRVRSPRKGILAEPVGVIDFTLRQRLCQARFLTCSQKYEPPRTGQQVGGAANGNQKLDSNGNPVQNLDSNGNPTDCMHFRDNRTGDKGCICPDLPFGTCPQGPTQEDLMDKDCVGRRFNEICRLITRLNQEVATEVNPFEVRDGDTFPQGQRIRIFIEGVIFEGVMTGNSFLWDTVVHPQQDEIRNPPCKRFKEAKFGWRRAPPTAGFNRTQGNGRTFEYSGQAINAGDCAAGGSLQTVVIDGAAESWRYYELFEAADFIGLNAGSEVFLESEAEILHIANLFGGTITGVAAYRTFGDQTILVNLPTDYYTVRLTDYGDYPNVQEIALAKPLSTYKDENWEDDIYITARSNVGPNPADCIKFLVDTYLATSGITMNAASYADVQPKVDKYPIGCMITDRPSVFDLINDIAYQSRCAAVIRDGELVLIYLSEEPTPIRTLTMADIVPESVFFSHGDTEDLKTRHDIKWSKSAAAINKDDDTERRILLKWNVPRYGTSQVNYDYYTQNTFSTILKSATFWMIREATTWKYIHFETPMNQLDLDVFDAIAINIPTFPANTTVVIQEANYNAASNTIKFKCWTPIRAGETVPYTWAWPAQQNATEKFPLRGTDDGRAGDALGLTVTPPLAHVLASGFSVARPGDLWAQVITEPGQNDIQTVGDTSPSDLDDIAPNLDCPNASEPLEDARDPFEFEDFKEVAFRQEDQFKNNQDNFGGGGGSTDEDTEETVCGEPHLSDTCTYEVKTFFITPQAVTTVQNPGTNCPGGGPCGCGAPGRPCFGPTTEFCHTFGALWAAQQFLAQKDAEADELWNNCRYECGKSDIWQAGFLKAIPGSAGYGGCEDTNNPGDPNAPGAGDGEITTPEQL